MLEILAWICDVFVPLCSKWWVQREAWPQVLDLARARAASVLASHVGAVGESEFLFGRCWFQKGTIWQDGWRTGKLHQLAMLGLLGSQSSCLAAVGSRRARFGKMDGALANYTSWGCSTQRFHAKPYAQLRNDCKPRWVRNKPSKAWFEQAGKAPQPTARR